MEKSPFELRRALFSKVAIESRAAPDVRLKIITARLGVLLVAGKAGHVRDRVAECHNGLRLPGSGIGS
jgi:hypothetical protein